MSMDKAIYFNWRNIRFRVSDSLHVEEVHGVNEGLLSGTSLSMVIGALLQKGKILKEI